MNVFLPSQTSATTTTVADDTAKIVDYASTGVGLGMSDVAMHLHHAVVPQDLDHGGEEELVRHYWTTINESLQSRSSNNDDAAAYPWEVAQRHYRLAVVDYARFFLGRFWKSATQESMEKRATSKNTCLLNRSIPAAMAFVRRVDEYLTEVEAEMAHACSAQAQS